MRHYEIVLLVHPDQSEQVPSMLERYRGLVENNGGSVHRSEDWGRLQLAYTIAKLHKAHYLMINIECDQATLDELEGVFRFNDAILRHLIVRKDKAETEPSVMMQRKDKKDGKDEADKGRPRERPASDDAGKDDSGEGGDEDRVDDSDDADSGDDAQDERRPEKAEE